MAENTEAPRLAGYGERTTYQVAPIGSDPTPLLPVRYNRTEAWILNASQDEVNAESSRSDYDSQVPFTAHCALANLETLTAGTWQISATVHVSGKARSADIANVALVVNDETVIRWDYQLNTIGAMPNYTLVIPQKAEVQLRTLKMASGKATYRTTLTATPAPTLSGSSSIIVSDKEQPLKTMVPAGFTLPPGKEHKVSSRQAVYAIALTATATVSVLDQW